MPNILDQITGVELEPDLTEEDRVLLCCDCLTKFGKGLKLEERISYIFRATACGLCCRVGGNLNIHIYRITETARTLLKNRYHREKD